MKENTLALNGNMPAHMPRIVDRKWYGDKSNLALADQDLNDDNNYEVCDACNGEGWTKEDSICNKCQGIGYIDSQSEEVKVYVKELFEGFMGGSVDPSNSSVMGTSHNSSNEEQQIDTEKDEYNDKQEEEHEELVDTNEDQEELLNKLVQNDEEWMKHIFKNI